MSMRATCLQLLLNMPHFAEFDVFCKAATETLILLSSAEILCQGLQYLVKLLFTENSVSLRSVWIGWAIWSRKLCTTSFPSIFLRPMWIRRAIWSRKPYMTRFSSVTSWPRRPSEPSPGPPFASYSPCGPPILLSPLFPSSPFCPCGPTGPVSP